MKIGLVGVGVMGQHHARLLAHIPEVRFAGIVDLDKKKAEK